MGVVCSGLRLLIDWFGGWFGICFVWVVYCCMVAYVLYGWFDVLVMIVVYS